MDYSKIRGFNYQPSYGTTSFENWLYFKPDIVELELMRGKYYFPKMNTIRLWLSWQAFVRDPEAFKKNFEEALRIAKSLDLLVIPTLFNRWHDPHLDNGGIYIDHFMPGWSWATNKENLFLPYLENIVGEYKEDERVLIWDICNEPFSYLKEVDEMKEVEAMEYKWLEEIYDYCKSLGTVAPISVSIHPDHGLAGIERIEPISDVLLVHPYYKGGQDDTEEKNKFEGLLKVYTDFREQTGKPMLVTETCWGSLDDKWREENIRYTLTEFKKRNLGWTVHALHHSGVADLHRPEYGPVGVPANLSFIEKDGSLRPGHDVFNEF
jgi:cellulase (glycosyl hydrolase family 5)